MTKKDVPPSCFVPGSGGRRPGVPAGVGSGLLDDRVLQGADALDLGDHHVAGFQERARGEADPGGRAGRDEVARLERDEARGTR